MNRPDPARNRIPGDNFRASRQIWCSHPAAGRMPAELKARLASQGQSVALRRPVLVPPPANPKPAAAAPVRAGTNSNPQAVLGYLGWALAAALAVALVVPRGAVPVADPAVDRAMLVDNAPDRLVVPWSPPTAPGYEQVKGDVEIGRAHV